MLATRNDRDDGRPLYERMADVIAEAIRSGELKEGDRLPPLRQLAPQLSVGVDTLNHSFSLLVEGGLVRKEGARGTFVRRRVPSVASNDAQRETRAKTVSDRQPWRRTWLTRLEDRLRTSHPDAIDLTRGSPYKDFYPVPELRDAWKSTVRSLDAAALEYPSHPGPEPELAEAILPLLKSDGVGARAEDLLAANSAQQFISLICQVLLSRAGGQKVTVAVEQPGYQTAMDTFEWHGFGLIGLEMDTFGVLPESLERACSSGAKMALFTPRAQSPTGVSWSPRRREELAAVLARHPDVIAFEDDHFSEAASTRPGSLSADPRLHDQVVYVRSFSKALAPDLRLAIGVAGSLRTPLLIAKSLADGWTSRLVQRAAAHLLKAPGTAAMMQQAQDAYAQRRRAFCESLAEEISLDGLVCGPDGLHVWVPMPLGTSGVSVVEVAARRGFLFAPSEPFFLLPGNDGFVRVNAGAADLNTVRSAAQTLVAAIREVSSSQRISLTP